MRVWPDVFWKLFGCREQMAVVAEEQENMALIDSYKDTPWGSLEYLAALEKRLEEVERKLAKISPSESCGPSPEEKRFWIITRTDKICGQYTFSRWEGFDYFSKIKTHSPFLFDSEEKARTVQDILFPGDERVEVKGVDPDTKGECAGVP